MLLTFFSGYTNKNKYLYDESLKILKRFNVHSKECKNTYFIHQKDIIKKIILYLFSSTNFRYCKKSINLQEINILSSEYDNVFVCIGPKSKQSFYNKNYNGYKITINSKRTPTCLIFENGFFITSENNKLVLSGGFVNKPTKYFYIIEIIQKSPIWKKYGCINVDNITDVTRSMSIDFFPFYYIQNNIVHIKGGSASGSTIAPALSYSLVNKILNHKNPVNFNFHISRINNKLLCSMLIILIIFFIYKHIKLLRFTF